MTFYNDMSISDFLDYASASSDEMASLGGGNMVDYETGKYFEVRDEQTAVFVASARNMVEELCKRNSNQKAIIEMLNATIKRQQQELAIAADMLAEEKAKAERYKRGLEIVKANIGDASPEDIIWLHNVTLDSLSEAAESADS